MHAGKFPRRCIDFVLCTSVMLTFVFLLFTPNFALQVLRKNLPSFSKPHQALADTHRGTTLQVFYSCLEQDEMHFIYTQIFFWL